MIPILREYKRDTNDFLLREVKALKERMDDADAKIAALESWKAAVVDTVNKPLNQPADDISAMLRYNAA